VITGDYFSDTFTFSGATLDKLTMAIAKNAVVPNAPPQAPLQGLIGIAYDSDEATPRPPGAVKAPYPNFIDQLVLQGIISTKSYSLWVNNIGKNNFSRSQQAHEAYTPLDATQGSILFGGVDSSKYTGSLTVVPLVSADGSGVITDFSTTLAGVEIAADGKTVFSVNTNTTVVLDSGTSLTYLPNDLANAINAGVGVVNDAQRGYLVPCAIANTSATLNFKFGNANGPVITASLSQFIDDTSAGTVNGTLMCDWGLMPAGSAGGPFLFGDTFLRSAYVVYNLDGKTVAIANANFNGGDSNIQPITAANSIPGATSTAVVSAESGPISTPTASFNLGTETGGASPTSTSQPGAASGLMAPSSSFVGTIVTGVAVLLSMISGSMFILL
jgi:Eukaryotic aspartyl protease